MRGGDDWDPEIERKLRTCNVFVLLVSPNSMSSDYIVDREVAIIRERQAKGEDVRFYPLLLTPTPKIALDTVRDKNMRPRDAKPLSSCSPNDRDQQMSDAVDEMVAIAAEIAKRKEMPLPAYPPAPRELDSAGADFAAPARSASPVLVSAPVLSALPSRPNSEEQRETEPQIDDQKTLQMWLQKQKREAAVAVAVRAVLRVVPIAIEPRQPLSNGPTDATAALASAMLRSIALARVVSKYPSRAAAVLDPPTVPSIVAAITSLIGLITFISQFVFMLTLPAFPEGTGSFVEAVRSVVWPIDTVAMFGAFAAVFMITFVNSTSKGAAQVAAASVLASEAPRASRPGAAAVAAASALISAAAPNAAATEAAVADAVTRAIDAIAVSAVGTRPAAGRSAIIEAADRAAEATDVAWSNIRYDAAAVEIFGATWLADSPALAQWRTGLGRARIGRTQSRAAERRRLAGLDRLVRRTPSRRLARGSL